MARQKPYNLYKRPVEKKNGKTAFVYYYSINPPSGVSTLICKKEQRKSTGCITRAESEAFVLDRIQKLKTHGLERSSVITFGEYAAPFYDWQRCPHVRRLQSEGKTITKNSVDKQRYVMIRHILSDEALCETPMAELRKADLLDYRDRLVGEMGRCRTSQKAFDIVKTICTEALFREEIDRDITVGLGKIQYESVEPGIFTEDEIRMLFADCPGHFVDQYDYTIFLMAASTGMRKGELFALKWQDIDFENGDLVIDAAWKGSELGKPKWEKTRSTVIPGVTLESLARLRGVAFNTADEKFIFSDAVGTVFGGTWWTKRFKKALESAGIDKKSRNLKPHSFRHTLNTILLAKGESAEKVRASFGWSGREVQDGYTHLEAEHFQGQKKKVEEIFEVNPIS